MHRLEKVVVRDSMRSFKSIILVLSMTGAFYGRAQKVILNNTNEETPSTTSPENDYIPERGLAIKTDVLGFMPGAYTLNVEVELDNSYSLLGGIALVTTPISFPLLVYETPESDLLDYNPSFGWQLELRHYREYEVMNSWYFALGTQYRAYEAAYKDFNSFTHEIRYQTITGQFGYSYLFSSRIVADAGIGSGGVIFLSHEEFEFDLTYLIAVKVGYVFDISKN